MEGGNRFFASRMPQNSRGKWLTQMAVIRPNGHKTDHSRVSVVNDSYFSSGVKEKVEILILPLPVPPRPILGASWGIGDGARLRSRFWVR